jgi:hypothetical protein
MNPFYRKENPASRKHRLKTAMIRSKRSRVFLSPDKLEERCLLAASLDITAGVLTYNGSAVDNNTTIDDTSNTGSGNIVISDTAEVIDLTPAAIALGWTGTGTNTVTGLQSTVTSMVVNGNAGSDVLTVLATVQPIWV